MYMIEIEESKVDKMSELAEKMLKYGGKLMACIEELSEESGMSERGLSGSRGSQGGGSMGSRYGEASGGGGSRGGYRERDEDWEEMEEMDQIGERRGVKGTGRYSRMRR